MILIDTGICIEILRANGRVIAARDRYEEPVGISFMSVAELYYGAAGSGNPVKNGTLIEEFLLTVEVVQTDLSILKKFGELKAAVRRQGLVLPDADIFIAATAYEKASLLITGNIQHFERFPDLKIENWISN
jgi:tRNA(fMet)-specific endonuclease VapC